MTGQAADSQATELAVVSGAAPQVDARVVTVATAASVRRVPWWRRLLGGGWRAIVGVVLAIYFVCAGTILLMQYIVIPRVPEYRNEIAGLISRAIGEPVSIGQLEAGWRGVNPTLTITDLRIHDKDGNVALVLPEVWTQLAWRSILFFEPRLTALVLRGPQLAVRRNQAGHLFVAGLELGGEVGGDSGLADWVLRQGEIAIEGGSLRWVDEKRAAPPLDLNNVSLRLRNRWGSQHQFALHAEPPSALASPFEFRAEWHGNSTRRWEDWSGRLYAQFDYIQLAAWRAYADYPLDLRAGRGGVRVWVDMAEAKVTHATADLALADAAAQLGAGLPLLELAQVHGRIGLSEIGSGRGFFGLVAANPPGLLAFGRDLSIVPRRGPAVAPFDFTVKWEPVNHRNPERNPERGEVRVTRLDLEPLQSLAGTLPLPEALRATLKQAQPKGALRDLEAEWTGPIEHPATYAARTRFSDLAFRSVNELPAVNRVSGALDLTHRGGNINVAGKDVTIELPVALRYEPQLRAQTFAAKMSWVHEMRDGAPYVELRFPSIDFANGDIAAHAEGSWHSTQDQRGFIDLEVRIPRAVATSVYRYIPFLPRKPHDFLREALAAGDITDGQFRFKGDLAKFPFEKPDEGTFYANVKFTKAMLAYHEEWPTIEAIDGEFTLDGVSLVVAGARGTILGTPISPTVARVANFDDDDPILEVNGSVDGNGPEFLHFIQTSPLHGTIGEVTARMAVEGRGRLQLGLTVPLRRPKEIKVAGSYQFLNNRVSVAAEQPPLTQVNGRFEFTERTLSATDINAQLLGGPTSVSITTRADRGYVIAAQGTASAAAVTAQYDFPFMTRAAGDARYRAQLVLTPASFDMTVDSNLQGVSFDMPVPFGKTAAETLPLHLERTVDEDRRTRNGFALRMGELVSVVGRFRPEGDRDVLDRVGVALGGAQASLPQRADITVDAKLKTIDIDEVLKVLPKESPQEPPKDSPKDATTATAKALPLGVTTVRAENMVAVGRKLTAATLQVERRGFGDWAIGIDAKELAGDIRLRTQQGETVTARFKHLIVPESASPPGTVGEPLHELPALDVTAESFTLNGRALGRLELNARNEDRAWLIKNLTLTTPEATLKAVGAWRGGATAESRTEVDLTIEASDGGKYLERFGQPNAVKGAVSKLTGRVRWSGPPNSIHYPTLAGTLNFNADKGQFLKADPGVGRLLGVLSLQALPRRITLDFRDVFSEGFSFDQITATASITRGILSTQDFRMTGAAAGVAINGDVDLAQETQKLRVRVVPVVGDSVAAVAGLALLNPLLGLGTFIAQRLLKDPLGQLLAYDYVVDGSWGDPRVTRVTNVDRGPADAAP